MSSQLEHSMFFEVLFPKSSSKIDPTQNDFFCLRQMLRFTPSLDIKLKEADLVVFDFETTGLDPNNDEIIEIGAQKIKNFEVIAEFSSLINPKRALSKQNINLTGITDEMLVAQPFLSDVLPGFVSFIKGSILVAHNADFDMGFLRTACSRHGYDIEWPCFCTLKLSKMLLPDFPERNLDALAAYYNITFQSRHRSIGDVRATKDILKAMLSSEKAASLVYWKDLAPVYTL